MVQVEVRLQVLFLGKPVSLGEVPDEPELLAERGSTTGARDALVCHRCNVHRGAKLCNQWNGTFEATC